MLAGVFDPIHLGHINFIEQTIETHGLDKVLILIEKTPQFKKTFAGFEHRKKMVELATTHNPKIKIYDSEFNDFPITNCLPKIKANNPKAKLHLLIGEDVNKHIDKWEGSKELLKNVKVIVAERNDGITSGKIRHALSEKQKPEGLDNQVYEYIKNKKLYQDAGISGA